MLLGIFLTPKTRKDWHGQLNKKLYGTIERLIKLGDFKGKEGTSAIVYGNAKIGAKRVLLVGLGEKKKATLNTVRKASANAAKKAVEMKAQSLTLALHKAFEGRLDLSTMGKAAAEGTYLGAYRYDEYVTESENGRLNSLKVEMIDSDADYDKKLNEGLISGIIIGKAQSYATDVS